MNKSKINSQTLERRLISTTIGLFYKPLACSKTI